MKNEENNNENDLTWLYELNGFERAYHEFDYDDLIKWVDNFIKNNSIDIAKKIRTHIDTNSFEEFGGMTLRDYFAAKAMQGMVSNGIKIDIDKDYPFQTRAETAYLIADAMLKERTK